MQTVAQSLNTAIQQPSVQQQVEAFLQESVGEWLSQRRYYTLKEGMVQEVDSHLVIQALYPESDELQHLAQLHELPAEAVIQSGTKVSWESTYRNIERKPSVGSTIFGVYGDLLLRDRGFMTPKPVAATFTIPKERTLCLRMEYQGSKFEEELKLIGSQYRTRQSIISRAGQEIMIGQYLEKRL
ncbi:MAG: phycobiliprotein lyase [Spirulina sp. SIO3F2]|nr:phycobiliprotein lyase [Spirulina sp. SIO3F2]